MIEWIRSLNEASVPFLVWLQSFASDGLTSFFSLMSWLGVEYFYILFFPFLYWCVSKRWGILTALSLIFSLYVGEMIKWAFKLDRPPSPPVVRLWEETSPGFVSTHAAPAAGVWGMMMVAVRRWQWALPLFLLGLSVSLSRLYLGVHYPADVIGGWIVGLIGLYLVLKLAEPWGERLARWPASRQLLAALLLIVALLAIFPSNWEGRRPAESGVLTTAVFFGLLLGLIWDHHRLHFSVRGPWTQRLLRYIVGLVLVLAAFLGLDILFEPFSQGNYLTAQAFRFVRYAAVGFVVPGLGPWLFQRLRLA